MAYVDGLTYSSEEIKAIYTGTSTEPYLLVDAAERTIQTYPEHAIAGVEGDHNSNPVRIRCPRYVDGADLTTCTSAQMSWQNDEAKLYGYGTVDSFAADPSAPDEYVIGIWLVDHLVCMAAGELYFQLMVTQTDKNGDVVYEWQTKLSGPMEVLPRVNSGTYTPADGSGDGYGFSVDEDELNAMLEEVLV